MEQGGIEIRLHGRGGQGTVTLAALLCDAAFRSGWFVLGFPAFGTERTGAPVAASIRLSTEAVRDRSQVRTPSILVVQDKTLFGAVDLLDGTSGDATLIVNAVEPFEAGGIAAVHVPATRIAADLLGVNKTSTVMAGAFAAATGLVTLEALEHAIEARFGGEMGVRNVAAARAGFHAVKQEVAA